MKGVFVRAVLALAVLVGVTSCGSHTEFKYFVAFSQANNAEPYRAAHAGLDRKAWGRANGHDTARVRALRAERE